jgi:hypothetical protein
MPDGHHFRLVRDQNLGSTPGLAPNRAKAIELQLVVPPVAFWRPFGAFAKHRLE